MDKYKAYLEDKHKEDSLLNEMLHQVEERKFEEAFGTAMRIKAIKDIKFELLKIERNDNKPVH